MCSLLGVSSCWACSQRGFPADTERKVLPVRGTAERGEGRSGECGVISLPCPSQCLTKWYCLLCGSFPMGGAQSGSETSVTCLVPCPFSAEVGDTTCWCYCAVHYLVLTLGLSSLHNLWDRDSCPSSALASWSRHHCTVTLRQGVWVKYSW